MVEEKTMAADAKEKKGKKIVKRKTVDKWKKKKWFSLLAPDFFDKQVLGETPAELDELVLNRTVQANIGEVSKQPKFRHIKAWFKVVHVSGQKAQTRFVGHEIQEGYMRKLVRRRSSKITVVKEITCKSGEKMRVKVVAFSAGRKASSAQKTEIRKRIENELQSQAQKKEFSQLVQELIFGNASNAIFKTIKGVVPIKRVEIQKTAVITEKQHQAPKAESANATTA